MARLKKEVLHCGKYLQMVQAGHWEYVERPGIPGAVVIVAVTDENQLLLVEQYRIPVGKRVIELPAGLAGDDDPNEAFAACARRELLEETGYEAREMELLADGPTTAGLSNEFVSLYRARGLKRVNAGGGHAGEEITVHAVELSKLPAWLRRQQRRGRMIDLKIWAGLYYVLAEDAAIAAGTATPASSVRSASARPKAARPSSTRRKTARSE